MKTEGLSINLATVRKQYGLKDGVEAFVKHGVRGISPWREHVQAVGPDEAGRILRGNGMTVTGYCRGGLFGAAEAAGQQAIIDDNLRMIDEAAAIGADCIVMIGGGMAPGSRDIKAARGRFADGMAKILPHARAAKVPLAIEPLHPMYRGRPRLHFAALRSARPLRCARRGRRRRGRCLPCVVGPESCARHRARRQAHPRASHLRLAGADQGPRVRPRHDGRRRDRPAGDPPHGRGRGLSRLSGGRDLLRSELVEAAGRRGDPHLHRALQHGLLSTPPAARRPASLSSLACCARAAGPSRRPRS